MCSFLQTNLESARHSLALFLFLGKSLSSKHSPFTINFTTKRSNNLLKSALICHISEQKGVNNYNDKNLIRLPRQHLEVYLKSLQNQ